LSLKKWKDKVNKNFGIDLNSFSDEIPVDTKNNIQALLSGEIASSQEKGYLLEDVIKDLFETLDFAISFNITNKETDHGQFDFIVDFVLRDDIKDILAKITEIEILYNGILGECKNYQDGVGKSLIEQACWRVCKKKKSMFYVAPKYKRGAISEINFFNNHHFMNFNRICWDKNTKLSIIPLDFNFLKVCLQEDVRFSSIIFFAIKQAKEGRINNILNLPSNLS
jgi:hypothetical protein